MRRTSLPQNYKQDMLAFLRTYLNDPSHIRDGAVSPPVLKTVGPGERYVACVRYNARDDHRKYMGVKTGAAVYVSGKLDRFIDGKPAQPYCKDAAYAPFPGARAVSSAERARAAARRAGARATAGA